MAKLEQQQSFPQQHYNINLLWAELIIEELTRHGITDFCIAPGSRSTPLTLAVANHAKTTSHVHFDERGLGFLALGLSKSSNKPVVVITTSGTAVANLYPAVIEAKQSQIPLIILTADRPPTLIDCAANQAIDQHRIFANYPVFFSQIPTPSESVDGNYLLTTFDQGLYEQQTTSGPIHINMAFTEPFYPDGKKVDFQLYLQSLHLWCKNSLPFTMYRANTQQVDIANAIDLNAQKVLVIVGRLQDPKQAKAIQVFCEDHQYILFADIQSQLQGTSANINGFDLLLENEQFKQLILNCELIIQFSDHLISKRLNKAISQVKCPVWLVSEKHQRIDPNHVVKQRFSVTAQQFIQQTSNSKTIDQHWFNGIHQYKSLIQESTAHIVQSPLNEISCTQYLLSNSNQSIMIGNSLAIRIADMFGQTEATIYSNRGASGIDGLIATTAGIAMGTNSNTMLLIGDTSFLYDLNSLALLRNLTTPLVIVVLNNDGGGIFNLLPVPEAQQKTFYQAPHGLNFADISRQFDIQYMRPNTNHEFKICLNNAQNSKNKNSTIIEVCFNNDLTPTLLKKIKDEVKNAVIS